MTSRFFLAAIVVVAVLAGCSKQAETPVPAPAKRPVVKAQAIPAPATTPSPDAMRADYDAAIAILDAYRGEPADLERARTLLMGLVNRDRNYAPAYVGLARAEYQSGYLSGSSYSREATERAWKFVSHALKLDPELVDAHITAAVISMDRGDTDIAQESLARAAEIQPQSLRLKLAQAALARHQGDVPEMVRLAREVVETSKDPHEVTTAKKILIDAYEKEGHFDLADAGYREVIELEPRNAWNHGNYAAFLLSRDDPDGAIRESEAALAIMQYPMATSILARALILRANREWDENRVTEAGQTLERVASIAGNDADIFVSLGNFYSGAAVRAKDPTMRTKALQWYEKASALRPDDPDLQRSVQRLRRTSQ